MRFLTGGLLVLLCGCGPGLVFNDSPQMSPDEMLQRADLVFVGVIETQGLESWPFFRLPGQDQPDSWKILRRRVRVETVLFGVETRRVIPVYEIFWTGPTMGDWNSTPAGQRALFLVRKEGGKYHVVRDWWRSIFPVTSGPHPRLPLDDSHPLWERIALMNWWIPRSDEEVHISELRFNDPGQALSRWRIVKLERGLVRHPSAGVRVPACRALLARVGQDECWDILSYTDRTHLSDGGYSCCSAADIATSRRRFAAGDAGQWWSRYPDRDERRLFTTVNNPRLRAAFCRLWESEYRGDDDVGCPPGGLPPATIVTEQGDVPLPGPWPR